MHVVVATHGHCFDGLASAVVFTRMLRAVEGPSLRFTYRGCGYGDGQPTATEAMLSGDENAILDYRFLPSPKLTWYFDHHRTAFAKPEDRAVFEERKDNGRYFFESEYTSCTKLIANGATTKFGVDVAPLTELVRWADVIDSANFESAEQALDRTNPVSRLAAVIERYGDDGLLRRLIDSLSEAPLVEVANSPEVSRRYEKISAQHDRFVERVKQRAVLKGRVVVVDLTDEELESIGKFVTYALYPQAVYSVIIGRLKNTVKISVGYNPWSGVALDADISAICARYGGGGHAVVGAVPFKLDELPRALEVAHAIADELAG
jgi:hypothetical protein